MKNYWIIIGVFLLFFFYYSKSTEWFVSNSTINGNGTETNPFNSINEAIQKSSEYDIITVLPGNYVANTNVNITKNIWLRSLNGSEYTIINGQNSNSPVFQIQSTNGNLTIEGFTFIKFPSLHVINIINSNILIKKCYFQNNELGDAIFSLNSTITTLECQFYNNYLGIETSGGDILISNCRFFYNQNGAIYSETSTNITIDNCIFSNNNGGSMSNSGALTIDCTGTSQVQINIFNSSFYANSQPTYSIDCSSCNNLNQTGNKFCGPNGNQINCNSWSSSLTWVDGCEVCGSYNTEKDCTGVCFGTETNCPSPKEIYVATNGTDLGSGNKTDPFLTIQHAINNSLYNDTIIVMPGTYNGTGNSNLLLYGKTVTIKTYSPYPEDTKIIAINNEPCFNFSSAESFDTIIEGFTLISNVAIITNYTNPTIKNCVFSNCVRGFSGFYSFSKIENCVFQQSPEYGIYINEGGFLSIKKCRFSENKLSSIYVSSSASVEIINCIFANNSVSTGGTIFMITAGTLDIFNSSFYNTSISPGYAVDCSPEVTLNQSGNVFCGNSSNDEIDCDNWTPSFVNVSACGVCVGAGYKPVLDCAGQCFGYHVLDNSSPPKCCLPTQLDCANICNGTKVLDKFGDCCYKNQTSINDTCCTGENQLLDKNGICCNNSEIYCNICYENPNCSSTASSTSIFSSTSTSSTSQATTNSISSTSSDTSSSTTSEINHNSSSNENKTLTHYVFPIVFTILGVGAVAGIIYGYKKYKKKNDTKMY